VVGHYLITLGSNPEEISTSGTMRFRVKCWAAHQEIISCVSWSGFANAFIFRKKIIIISTQCCLLCRLTSYSVNNPKWRSLYQGTPLTHWRESHTCRWRPRLRNRILTFPRTEGLSWEGRYRVLCGSVRTCRGRQQKFHSWENFSESKPRWWNGEKSNMRGRLKSA